MKTRSVIFLLLVMLLSITGCDGSTDESTMGTVVAATLEAMGVDEAGVPVDPPSPDAPAEVSETPTLLPPTEVSGPGVLQVAYISGGNVWFVEEGAAPTQLTSSGNVERVVISKDGQLAAFTWYDISLEVVNLRVVNTVTGTEWVLFSQPDLDAIYPLEGAIHHVPYQFDFIPGTHTVLVNTRRIFEGPGLVQNNDLWSIDADTSARTMLLDYGLGGDFYFSPSGDMLALVLPTSMGFVRPDGSDLSPDHLTFPFVMTYSEYAYYPIPVWAPDESAVAVIIPAQDPFIDDSALVWRVPVEGPPTPLLDITGFLFFRNQGKTPAIAPDLSQVVFLREVSTTTSDLVVAPLDGSAESIYTSGNLSWQGWNPDSTQFVYTDTPRNLNLGSMGVTAAGIGFGSRIQWVDADTFLYLDELTSTHRFAKVDLPGPASVLDVISGSVFGYDFTE
ncbi:MAG: hypothetical protein KAI06_09890 [Anaerolineales bacterium]|nr:hypothetical protein [Anaerolineales bacterium]